MKVAARSWRERVGRIALVAWFSAMLCLGAGLLARHLVALPAPLSDSRLASSLDELRAPDARGRWLAAHVLYSDCRCSQRIVDHLLASERPRDWSEMILWVGDAAPDRALYSHFDVRRVSPADLARLGIEAAPLLVALDPQGHLRYAGGYTERKQGPVIEDLEILQSARHPKLIAGLPVFGCAVSERLQRQLAALPVP